MMRKVTQKGVTLLEVLVGFVIFSASLVAVLNYVGDQVFLYQKTSHYFNKYQALYNLISMPGYQEGNHRFGFGEFNDLSWSLEVTELEVVEKHKRDLVLLQHEYVITGPGNDINWSVLRVR